MTLWFVYYIMNKGKVFMDYFEKEKQGQLEMLFNNFKIRFKNIYEKDDIYASLQQKIDENNKTYYDKMSDELFLINGKFDNDLFEKAIYLIDNYQKLRKNKLEELEKAKKSFFGKKKKVALAEKNLNKIDNNYKKYVGSIKKYKEFVKNWSKDGIFVDINKENKTIQKRIFNDLLTIFFMEQVQKSPEILLAKQSENSILDKEIANFLEDQKVNFNMQKIENDFDNKLRNMKNQFKPNPNTDYKGFER